MIIKHLVTAYCTEQCSMLSSTASLNYLVSMNYHCVSVRDTASLLPPAPLYYCARPRAPGWQPSSECTFCTRELHVRTWLGVRVRVRAGVS